MIFLDFPPCHSGQFRCENALCIPARWRCDGYKVSKHNEEIINIYFYIFLSVNHIIRSNF